MKKHPAHANTSALLEAWRRLFQDVVFEINAPATAEYPGVVDRVFLLQRADPGDFCFRTAGADVERLLGRNLTDQNFLNIWRAPDRALVDAALETVIADSGPALIEARGETVQGRTLHLEIALAPLIAAGGSGRARILGLYQSLSTEIALNNRPIAAHKVLSVHAPAPRRVRPNLRLVASRD